MNVVTRRQISQRLINASRSRHRASHTPIYKRLKTSPEELLNTRSSSIRDSPTALQHSRRWESPKNECARPVSISLQDIQSYNSFNTYRAVNESPGYRHLYFPVRSKYVKTMGDRLPPTLSHHNITPSHYRTSSFGEYQAREVYQRPPLQLQQQICVGSKVKGVVKSRHKNKLIPRQPKRNRSSMEPITPWETVQDFF